MKRWLEISRLSLRSHKMRAGAGYTITEVMIVLAVTTVMFLAVAIVLRGRQSRTEFTQAVRNFEAKMESLVAEVSNGVYSSATPCTASGNFGAPTLNGTNTPGSCIFIGKVFDLSSTDRTLTTISTMVGRRTVRNGTPLTDHDVTTLAEAAPVLLPDVQTYRHSFQLSLTKAVLGDGTSVSAFGFVVPLANVGSLTSGQGGGAQQIRLYSLTPGQSLASGYVLNQAQFQPLAQGLKLCLRGQNGQRAEIDIGRDTNSDSLLYTTLDTPNTGVCSD